MLQMASSIRQTWVCLCVHLVATFVTQAGSEHTTMQQFLLLWVCTTMKLGTAILSNGLKIVLGRE